uniref:Uncharacterized protein n=1 Tax=Sphaerodactylus townsendi TaxID=933632 RepID=A0ACB8G5Z0_9SAUR
MVIVWHSAFQEMDWDQLDVNPRVIAAVKKANLRSIKDVLNLSGADLQRLTKLSCIDVQYLLRAVSGALRKYSGLTALQLFQDESPTSQRQKLSLGCRVLDGLLRGGIPLTGITEIAGESSAGKTQIGLQLCLSVQYPYEYGGLECGFRYESLSSSLATSAQQSEQIWGCGEEKNLLRKLSAGVPQNHGGGSLFETDCSKESFTLWQETFHECIAKKINALLARGMVRLIVVDSIAALFRCEFAAKDSVLKAKYLQTFGAKLLRLSSAFRTPVVCINQVTDTMGEGASGDPSSPCSAGKNVVPALGITWSNQLLMRLMSACCYTVNPEGVKGIQMEIPTG